MFWSPSACPVAAQNFPHHGGWRAGPADAKDIALGIIGHIGPMRQRLRDRVRGSGDSCPVHGRPHDLVNISIEAVLVRA